MALKAIVDTSLREGWQWSYINNISIKDQIRIALGLDDFGIDYIEVGNPSVRGIRLGIQEIAKLGLKNAKIVSHIRARKEDIEEAAKLDIDGINTYFGTSPYSQKVHGKSIGQVTELVIEALDFAGNIKPDWEIRFSEEDASRTPILQSIRLYRKILPYVDRIGFPDTTGRMGPLGVYIRCVIYHLLGKDLEFHGHNDLGNADDNAFNAIRGGATHISTTINGVGERNGITSLQGLIAEMIIGGKGDSLEKYELRIIDHLEHLGNEVYNMRYEGPLSDAAFSHKAGIHTRAIILGESNIYEILKPEDFGKKRRLHYSSVLVSKAVIAAIAEGLGVNLKKPQIYEIVNEIKKCEKDFSPEDVGNMILAYRTNTQNKKNLINN